MGKIVCFGEIMLRLSPPLFGRFVQCSSLDVNFGGAEANAACALAQFGCEVSFVSKLPEHEIGQAAVNSLRSFGVGTDDIVRSGANDRIGIYYLENGASQRRSKVVYDRKYSAISLAKRGDFDWDKIFACADWFHFTGITPALGGEMTDITLDALKAAKSKGITVSFDLNYRSNLWTVEQASPILSSCMKYADMFFCGYDDPSIMFGIHSRNKNSVIPCDGDYLSLSQQMSERWGLSHIIWSCRESMTASDNKFSAIMYSAAADSLYKSRTYDIHIVDRIGGGDALDAGIIYAVRKNKTPQDTIEYGTAASVMKHSVQGDILIASDTEVEALSETGGTGRVQR